MRQYKIAIVGCGVLGSRHATNASAHEDATVAYTYDINPEQSKTLAQKVGAEPAESFEQILESDVDAIMAATPYQLNHDLAIRAMRAGKHAFVEKPMTLDIDQAQKMVDVQAETGKVLQVGHILRFYPANFLIKQIIDSGELGALFQMRYHAEHHTDITERSWMASKEAGGVNIGGGIHHTDLISWWGGKVTAVRSYGKSVMPMYQETGMHDHGMILYELENGAIGESCYSLATHSTEIPYNEAMLSFEHGSVLLNHTSGDIYLTSEHGVLEYAPGRHIIPSNNDWGDGLVYEMAGFISAIQGEPPRITPAEAKFAVQIALAAKQSAEADEPGVRVAL